MTIIMRKLFKNYSKIIQKKINIILKRKKHHMEVKINIYIHF